MAANNRNGFSYGPPGHESEIEELAGTAPVKVPGELLSLFSFWWLQVLGDMATSLCPLLLSSHGLSSAPSPPSIGTLVSGVRANTVNPGWSHFEILDLIMSAKMPFPNKVPFKETKVRTWTFLGGVG